MVITALRERLAGWIVWLIVGLICITFALWGIQSYFEGLNRVVVAEVNGEEISYEDYQSALQSRRSNMARAFGGRVDQSMFNTPEFRTQTVEELVGRSILSEDVRESGYRVGDEALNAQIQSFPAFQGSDGKFNNVRSAFSSSAFVTDTDIERLLKLTQQEREVDYFLIEASKYEEDVEVEDAAVIKEFEDNKEAYRLPERMKVEFVELSVPDLMEDVSVSDEDLQVLYDESRDQYIQEHTDQARRRRRC